MIVLSCGLFGLVLTCGSLVLSLICLVLAYLALVSLSSNAFPSLSLISLKIVYAIATASCLVTFNFIKINMYISTSYMDETAMELGITEHGWSKIAPKLTKTTN